METDKTESQWTFGKNRWSAQKREVTMRGGQPHEEWDAGDIEQERGSEDTSVWTRQGAPPHYATCFEL